MPTSELAMHFHLNRMSCFLLFVVRRLVRDHCAQIAASLTYTSLLATVPFLIISFTVISKFTVFPELVNNLQTVLLEIFTPDIGQEVNTYVHSFITKGKTLPVVSMVILFVTVMTMLYTIDDTLNRIWQVEHRRRTWIRLCIYIIVIVSGPVLVGISLALTTYLISRPILDTGTMDINWLTSVPWLVTLIAFSAVYRWVPNTEVRWRYAIAGGLLAMILFELAKWGFALYIRWVPTYNLLYGTLAAIPFTLVWLYISWLVVLIGAETARCLATFEYGVDEADLTARQLIGFFHRTRDGGATRDQIAAWGYLGKRRVDFVLSRLLSADYIYEVSPGKYLMTEKSQHKTVEQLRLELVEQLKMSEN